MGFYHPGGGGVTQVRMGHGTAAGQRRTVTQAVRAMVHIKIHVRRVQLIFLQSRLKRLQMSVGESEFCFANANGVALVKSDCL